MFAVMNIVRVDHALQVTASLLRPPLQSLMYNDIVKYEVEQSVTKYSQADADHIGIVVDLREIVKDRDGGQAEDEGEEIILFQGFIMNSVM
jgi:hypothetical protein